MLTIRKPTCPLGITSLVLSAVGLLLFFMPVLGIPLGCCGLLSALLALPAAVIGAGRWDRRWAALALVFSLLVLAADIVVAWSPQETVPHQVERRSPPPTARPYVSPPEEP